MIRRIDTPPKPKPREPRARPRGLRAVLAFAQSRTAGGMLIGSAFLLLMMAWVGGMLVDYGLRDAQWAEVKSAIRAAVASAAQELAGGGPISDQKAKAAIAAFASAAAPGLDAKGEDVTITRAPDGTVTVVVGGTYVFDRLFAPDSTEAVAETTRVEIEAEFYEVALAIDRSESMARQKLMGARKTKAYALSVAAGHIIRGMQSLPEGHMMVSVVPFSDSVKAADTCHGTAEGSACNKARSPGKETYVRLLSGIDGTIDDALARGRDDRTRGRGGHWVDGYHQYGVGADMGPLGHQYLPEDLLDDVDWDLRRIGVDIDVAAQIPLMGTWTVNDEDFWNGCVMARWGAYWRDDARPPGWAATNPRNWPVKRTVPAWGQGVPALSADTPLHLSDAPPDHAYPNTLFTALSYPDARIGAGADHRLELTMLSLFHDDYFSTPLNEHTRTFDNDWSVPGGRGSLACRTRPISALTTNLDAVRATAARQVALSEGPEHLLWQVPRYIEMGRLVPGPGGELECRRPYCSVVENPRSGVGRRVPVGTLVHLGVVWGLRTLSPLWQKVWGVTDPHGTPRPARPCGGGPQTGCIEKLHKAIILITDGQTWPGDILASRLIAAHDDPRGSHPAWRNPGICSGVDPHNSNADYHDAAAVSTETLFHERFRAASLVDASGRFTRPVLEQIATLLHRSDPSRSRDNPAKINAILNLLEAESWTAWQLFRELDPAVVDALMAPSPNGDASDPANPFGFLGRPMHRGHYCELLSVFGPYGRVADTIRVGERTPGQPAEPVPDVAPYRTGDTRDRAMAKDVIEQSLRDWLVEACRVAGERKVKIIGIYFPRTANDSGFQHLQDCIAANGGNINRDLLSIPDETTLDTAFENIFVHRRLLRFTN